MIPHILLLCSGILLTSVGFLTIICYLNFLVIGYNFHDYIHFISTDILCWCFPVGIILIMVYLWLGGKK